MGSTDRLDSELAFHNAQAGQRSRDLVTSDDLCFDDDTYLDHETWIRPAFDRLQPLIGKSVLDYGCGHGMASVVLARQGAQVTAFDLSPGYLGEAARRALANGVDFELVQADGEHLPFADESFDRVWGNAVLHHLDLRRAARELWRVLRPGGVAVFCEPWGENPLLDWARRWLPYPGKARTVDERPLRWRQLGALREVFPSLEIAGHQLLSMVRRVLGRGRLSDGLEWCDRRLLRLCPMLERFCRYMVLTLRRPT
jgi:ubiquinone/menaquinone biosynthesis C-methylase UbiE